MNDPAPSAPSPANAQGYVARRVRLLVLLVLQGVMATELVLLLGEGRWASGFWLLAIMAVTGAPAVLGDRLPVRIPPEYELLAILFVFASLFLGEFLSYYERFWWWDIALHTTSGLLLGIHMQKPMLHDPSGLTDTMWDLIVDTLGAAVISGFGWWHMKRNRRSFIEVWIEKFIRRNPGLFRH